MDNLHCLWSASGEVKKQRKPRKKKDPNAPKKALSGFMFFSNANRERIKTENPGIPFGQVGAGCMLVGHGRAWNLQWKPDEGAHVCVRAYFAPEQLLGVLPALMTGCHWHTGNAIVPLD